MPSTTAENAIPITYQKPHFCSRRTKDAKAFIRVFSSYCHKNRVAGRNLSGTSANVPSAGYSRTSKTGAGAEHELAHKEFSVKLLMTRLKRRLKRSVLCDKF